MGECSYAALLEMALVGDEEVPHSSLLLAPPPPFPGAVRFTWSLVAPFCLLPISPITPILPIMSILPILQLAHPLAG